MLKFHFTLAESKRAYRWKCAVLFVCALSDLTQTNKIDPKISLNLSAIGCRGWRTLFGIRLNGFIVAKAAVLFHFSKAWALARAANPFIHFYVYPNLHSLTLGTIDRMLSGAANEIQAKVTSQIYETHKKSAHNRKKAKQKQQKKPFTCLPLSIQIVFGARTNGKTHWT